MAIDRDTLNGLISAWNHSGDTRLLGVILDGALELHEPELARPVLDGIDRTDVDGRTACTAARLMLAMSRAAEAEALYDAAIIDNPTLEDPELAQAIADAIDGEPEKVANVVSISDRWQVDDRNNADNDKPDVETSHASREAIIRFADVGGLEDVKAQIRRKIITPFQKPSLFQRFRRKAGGGVMLYGPPGCGKTMLARATAGECEARFINVHIAEVLDMYVGESEKRLAAVFTEARRETPTVLFFDELEALAARRHSGTGDAKASMVSTFLSELDGFEANNDGVLVLAATNTPWAVDPAFRRPGRFDRLQFVPPPDRSARVAILKLMLEGRPGGDAIKADEIASRCGGYSGADLQNLVDTAVDIAIEESLDSGSERPLTMAHMRAAFDEVRPTTLEWLTTARNYAKYSNIGGQYDEIAKFLERHGR